MEAMAKAAMASEPEDRVGVGGALRLGKILGGERMRNTGIMREGIQKKVISSRPKMNKRKRMRMLNGKGNLKKERIRNRNGLMLELVHRLEAKIS